MNVETKADTENKKKLFSSFGVRLIALTVVVLLIYISYVTLKRKFMSIEERVRLVENLNAKHEELYNRLDNYEDHEYNQKLQQYLEFVINHSKEIRHDMRLIFQEKPKYNFKTKNQILIGGRTKSEFYRNVKAKNYLISEYSEYLNEVKELIGAGNTYDTKPHRLLGKKFRKSKVNLNPQNELTLAQKNYSLAKASYQSYTNRLEENILLYKKTQKQFSEWKINRKNKHVKPKDNETITDGQQLPEEKSVFSTEGMTNKEIYQTFVEMLTKIKLEIPNLRKLKQESYETFKRNKMRYDKLREESNSNGQKR